ncbi:hypothetical protein H6F55_25455 [Phormidium sp. FACHB-322]|uniref:hypothetical protein n=2 Tax=Cyanophyceae TaxID=3028117 RepID=UPI0016822355|nr:MULTISPECIES: hypothetical protein [Cyanophyceae]MBD1918823.1 hypothetical protein [Phormidium sp. FACHB-77]MBD2033334.1 hypothetical protein [Phormidium sp. FACHB-322]MBD2053733.1 hypothetical protein [Leptolyngbya sp. FACHB-60]
MNTPLASFLSAMRKLLSNRLGIKICLGLALVTAMAVVGLSTRLAPVLATVAAAPRLVPAILNGSPVSVLYVTRSSDTVLARCYPGFEPSLTLRAMGSNTEQTEGVLTCVSRE